MASFSEAVKACLPELPWGLTDVEVSQRRDLRSQRVFTIDARDAKGELQVDEIVFNANNNH
jgi:exoribonuclease R